MKRIIAGLILFLFLCNFVFAADEYQIDSNPTNSATTQTGSIEISRLQADISVLRSEIADLKTQNEQLVSKSDVNAYRQDLQDIGYKTMQDFFMKLILVNMVYYIFIMASLFVLKGRKML